MDIQLKELLEKIKNEGIDAAQAQGQEIVAEAKRQAGSILEDANKKAEALLADAKQKASVLEASARESLKQAARDLLLTVDQDLQKKFQAILDKSVSGALDNSVLKDLIVKVLSGWQSSAKADLAVQIDPAVLDSVKDFLLKSLAEDVKKGLKIEAGTVSGGFRVQEKDGRAYFDFTSGTVADILSGFLNPKLAEILKGA